MRLQEAHGRTRRNKAPFEGRRKGHEEVTAWASSRDTSIHITRRLLPGRGTAQAVHVLDVATTQIPEFVQGMYVVGLDAVVARARVLIHVFLDRCAQAAARGGPRCASQVLGRGAQADAGGAAPLLGRGAQAVARGAARWASQVPYRGAKADTRGAAQVINRGGPRKFYYSISD
jgi:hypothetical protein